MPPKKTFVPNIVDFLANRDFVFELEPVARKEFLSQISQIVHLPAFLTVINDMENKIACAGIMGAVENAKVASTIRTIEEIKNKFLSLSVLFDKTTAGEEDFDEHSSI